MLQMPKLNKPTGFQWFKIITVLLVVALSASFIYFRGIDFKNCVMAQYDLKRDTEFRLLTGACTTQGKDGSLIYVNQLRGFGSDVDGHDAQ